MPNIRSASVTARVISRMLKKAGFTRADTSNKNYYKWTEGFCVNRVFVRVSMVCGRLGFGNTVCIHYKTPDRLTRQEFIEKARTLLLEKGYEFDTKYTHGLYINCEFP